MDQLIKRIDFFKNPTSKYGVLDYFAYSVQKVLRSLRIRSSSIDVFQQSREAVLKYCEKYKPDFTFGFNVMVSPYVLYETLGIPHIAAMVDFASYYPALFSCYNCIAAYTDMDSCRYAEYFGHKAVVWFPHAVEKEMVNSKSDRKVHEAKRDLDVVFCGSFIDADEIYLSWKLLFSKKVYKILESVVEEVLSSASLHLFDVFQKAYTQKDVLQNEMKRRGLSFHDVISSLDKCLRGRDRVELLRSLKGIPFHIFASPEDIAQWKRALSNMRKVRFHDNVPYTEIAKVYLRAKVAVNSIPMVKNGYHERLFISLAQGASVLTNKSQLIEQTFASDTGVHYFSPPEYSTCTKSISQILQDEDSRLQAVSKARKIILKEHTWDVRIAALLQSIPDLIRYLEGFKEEKRAG